MRQRTSPASWRRAARVGILGLSVGALGACDDLLDVELTHLLTEEAIEAATTAELQVMSAIALFECGTSTFGWIALGHEDVLQSIAGVTNTAHVWRDVPVAGTCDTSSGAQAWFDQFMGARFLISTDPAKLNPTGTGYLGLGTGEGVYDKITDGRYAIGNEGERLAAIAAIYMAATLKHFGEFYCEGALDQSAPMVPDDFLALAETWITSRALAHITAYGANIALPNAAAASAQLAALALRAQIRWARGDLAGADGDAQTVLAADPDFTFWVTRESGEQRRNKVFHAAQESRYSGMLGPVDWWNPAQRAPNPATGQLWTNPIPFTGYIFLGIGSEGETLGAGNVPLTWATRDVDENVVPSGGGVVEDTRVPHDIDNVQGPGRHENPRYYGTESENEPVASWRELTLIRADYALSQNDLQGVIDYVNGLRAFHALQEIEGAYETALLASAAATRAMLLEERRRELFSQGGRYWSTKIQNPDMLWFPRRQGQTPAAGYVVQGGVRLAWATDEYTLNPNFTALGDITAVRGSLCDPAEAPHF